MKLPDKISWLMGRVQRSLFPHLDQCLPTQLTAQEECLVSILEIVQVERHVPKSVTRFRYPGRKPLDQQAMAPSVYGKGTLSASDDQRSVSCLAIGRESSADMRVRCFG